MATQQVRRAALHCDGCGVEFQHVARSSTDVRQAATFMGWRFLRHERRGSRVLRQVDLCPACPEIEREGDRFGRPIAKQAAQLVRRDPTPTPPAPKPMPKPVELFERKRHEQLDLEAELERKVREGFDRIPVPPPTKGADDIFSF